MSHTVGKPDPFGQRRRLAHSAISDEYRLTPETYENLFGEVFFESQIYRVWSQGNRPWALHCYGDPGCGKTTLAAITVNRLRAHGTSSVVSVFIGKDTKVSAADLLEDLLVCIHNQLRSIDPETDNHFAQYETACRYGESVSRRTTLLRVAITSLLDKHQHTFLVIDGYDRVGHDLQILLDRELADLRAHRLRVMLTRRVPAFEPPRVKICDGCQAYNLKLYWSCKACFALQLPFDLCYDCRVKERICVVHGVAHFEESYNHVSTDVSYPDNMEEYLLWELRRMSRVPQLHMFLEDAGMSQRIIKSMSYDRNITIAKLYLDNVFREQCLDVVVKVNDRLPRNIIAMFDDGIGRIKQRPDREADIGLLAIAAVGENNQGIALVSLANWMRDALSRLPYLAQAPPRSLEDILRYTNGFIQERVSNSGDRYVSAYSVHFARYIKENYNSSLFWARNQLNIYRTSKTWTAISQIPPRLTSPPLVSSPPITADRFGLAGQSTIGASLRPQIDYFDQSSRAGVSAWQPQALPRHSLPALPTKSELDLKKKELGPLIRSYTMTSVQRNEFGSNEDSVEEEPEQLDYEKQRWNRSMHRPTTSRLCGMCETHILGCGKLSGIYRRDYSSVTESKARACVFCASLYKDFLDINKAHPDRVLCLDSQYYCWSIRTAARSRESKSSILIMFHPAMKKEDIESSVAPLLGAGCGSKASYDVASHSRGTQSHFKDDASHLGSIYPSRMFHFIAEDELGQSLMKDELGATTDVASKAVGLQVKAWIYNCNEHHENCMKASKTTWVPTRLLDLVFGDESSIRLVNAKEEGVQGPYVTLSHCWGPNPKFLTTTREREKLHMTKGIKISDLKSTNFEEAISVARHLGIRYIWIDSLCIIQGLNGDFQAEGQLMHKVYRNSYCNLAAADSKDSHGGLFRKRQSSDVLPGGYEGDGSSPIFGTTAWRIMPDNLWDAELLDTEIYKRGWVFQERMLSPRILHFARNQIFWDCGAISACETLPSGLPLMLDDAASTDRHWRGRLQESSSLVHAPLAGVNTDSLGEFWSSAVLSYTQCDLTDQVDKTRAIWSIAKLVRDAWGDDYGVGTWALAVEEQLNWTVINIKTTVRSVDLQWRLPSWSWMSIQGAVSVPKRVLDDRCYRVKGHDEKDIRFVIKGAAKPVFGRIPSDSIKKDMQLGWDKWQKETTRRLNSSSGARANPTQERSQSAPVVPKQDIGIANKSVKDEPAAVADPRDLEPELISNSIKIKAPITPGTLYYDDETGNYNILAKSYDGSKLGETFASNEDNLVGKADSSASAPSVILFMAYPDVTPSSFDLAPNYSHVIILRAKSHTIQKASSGLGIGFEEQAYGSDNEPELPISYSGTGIIVTPTVDYRRQYNHFADDITHLEKKITSLKEDWKIENSKKDLEGLKAWIEDLGREGHWRRTGMVEFKDWSEKDWESVMGRQIWDVMRAQSSPREENDGGEAVYPMGWGTEFWLD